MAGRLNSMNHPGQSLAVTSFVEIFPKDLMKVVMFEAGCGWIWASSYVLFDELKFLVLLEHCSAVRTFLFGSFSSANRARNCHVELTKVLVTRE
jgi:hypothetical protein